MTSFLSCVILDTALNIEPWYTLATHVKNFCMSKMSRLENAKEEFDHVPFSRLKSRFWTNDMMYTYPFAHPSQQTKTGETKTNPIFLHPMEIL